MSEEQPNYPLHGITLKTILEDLVARHGWETLAQRVKINCFKIDPTLKSSLKFLRKTPWARRQVEAIYIEDQRRIEQRAKRNRRRAEMRAHREAVAANPVDSPADADPPADPPAPPPATPAPPANKRPAAPPGPFDPTRHTWATPPEGAAEE